MLNKYRMPFLLLGIGIGIILTNTIYKFNPTIEYREASEEEIIEQATDLGMVFIKENIEISSKNEEDNKKIKVKDEEKEVKKKGIEKQIIIEAGDTLEKVSKDLYELDIIDNREEFNKFAKDKGVDKKLRVGTYKILDDYEYETIIKILTKDLQ